MVPSQIDQPVPTDLVGEIGDGNPYRTPEADVEVEVAPGDGEPTLFVVGTTKLVLLSLCTFGLYEIWWIYKNWSWAKTRSSDNMSPVWRAVFAPLWLFALVAVVRDRAAEVGLSERVSPGFVGGLYLALSASIQLPDPWWLIAMLTFIPLVRLQNTAAAIEKQVGSDPSELQRWNVWNWLAVVLGGLLFVLTILGTFLPEVPIDG